MSIPSNTDIADALDELGDLYELDGAIIHRVVAYRNGAKAVRDASVSVGALAVAGTATELAGIGDTLQEKIAALVQTGTIPALEKLRARYPPGLVQIRRLPGVGPKRAKLLFAELGIDSPAALRTAAEADELQGVKGLGAKFQASVLEALDAVGDEPPTRERVLLDRALESGRRSSPRSGRIRRRIGSSSRAPLGGASTR